MEMDLTRCANSRLRATTVSPSARVQRVGAGRDVLDAAAGRAHERVEVQADVLRHLRTGEGGMKGGEEGVRSPWTRTAGAGRAHHLVAVEAAAVRGRGALEVAQLLDAALLLALVVRRAGHHVRPPVRPIASCASASAASPARPAAGAEKQRGREREEQEKEEEVVAAQEQRRRPRSSGGERVRLSSAASTSVRWWRFPLWPSRCRFLDCIRSERLRRRRGGRPRGPASMEESSLGGSEIRRARTDRARVPTSRQAPRRCGRRRVAQLELAERGADDWDAKERGRAEASSPSSPSSEP